MKKLATGVEGRKVVERSRKRRCCLESCRSVCTVLNSLVQSRGSLKLCVKMNQGPLGVVGAPPIGGRDKNCGFEVQQAKTATKHDKLQKFEKFSTVFIFL